MGFSQQKMVTQSSINSALLFLSNRILCDDWCRGHQDIAYYFKAPRAFLESGRIAEAKIAFERLKPFLNDGAYKSANPAYATMYPHYPWMWASHSALCLGEVEMAGKCDELLRGWQTYDGTGVVLGGEGDMFATSITVFNHLCFGRIADATRSGDVLRSVIDRNRSTPSNKFFLRWDTDTLEWGVPPQGPFPPAAFYEVDQQQNGQLYFMLGFPAMVLHALAQTTGKDEYHEAAMEVLHFLRGCREDVGYSIFAHKVAMAASMLGDSSWANKFCIALISEQFEHGGYMQDGDDMDTVDQTAELACWLQILCNKSDREACE